MVKQLNDMANVEIPGNRDVTDVSADPASAAIGRRGFIGVIAAGLGAIAVSFGLPARQRQPDATSKVSNVPARHFVCGDDLAG